MGASSLPRDYQRKSTFWWILQERMILTVEPGIYFNSYQMDKGLANPKQAPFMNKVAG